jgi:periplasmic protein TonB
VRDPVNTVLVERQSLERGFGGSLLLSGFGHAFLLAALLIVSLLPPARPRMDGIFAVAVPLPRGGGGVPDAPPPATIPAQPEAPKPEAPAAAPTKILKPLKDEPSRALPDPNSKKPAKAPPPREVVPPDMGVSRSTAGAAGASSQAQGLDLAFPPGVGTPTGVTSGGDYYLATVQQRIWMIWMQQVRTTDQSQTVSVVFTILADGSVTDVDIPQPSGVTLLDLAAKRAVLTAAPFRPLPKSYGKDRLTIQANFKPTS